MNKSEESCPGLCRPFQRAVFTSCFSPLAVRPLPDSAAAQSLAFGPANSNHELNTDGTAQAAIFDRYNIVNEADLREAMQRTQDYYQTNALIDTVADGCRRLGSNELVTDE